jgi:hypothetical protein
MVWERDLTYFSIESGFFYSSVVQLCKLYIAFSARRSQIVKTPARTGRAPTDKRILPSALPLCPL